VLDILTSNEYRKLSYNELQEIISEYLNEDPTFSEEAAQNVINELITELNEVLERNGQQKLPQRKKGGGTYAYFKIINHNGKLSVEISSDIRPELKSKMKRAFQQVLENHNKTTAQFSDATRNAALV
jgi:predicted house-cleaning noncanonical NTP pyrophosphatase (MazG superfamily)